MRNNHEIDFRVFGEEMQCVEIELDPQETVVAESGAFMYMDDGIQMQTIFGDGSKSGGGFFDKILGAGKRLLTGESLFMTAFTHQGAGKARVEKSFAKKTHSFAQRKALQSASSGRENWEQDYSAAKDSSCKRLKVTDMRSAMPVDTL
jgi:hypothetical protein